MFLGLDGDDEVREEENSQTTGRDRHGDQVDTQDSLPCSGSVQLVER